MLLEWNIDFYMICGCVLVCWVWYEWGLTHMHTSQVLPHQMLLGRPYGWRKIKCSIQILVFNCCKTVVGFQVHSQSYDHRGAYDLPLGTPEMWLRDLTGTPGMWSGDLTAVASTLPKSRGGWWTAAAYGCTGCTLCKDTTIQGNSVPIEDTYVWIFITTAFQQLALKCSFLRKAVWGNTLDSWKWLDLEEGVTLAQGWRLGCSSGLT